MTFYKILKNHKVSLLFLSVLVILINCLVTFIDPIAIKLLIDKGIIGKNLKLFLLISAFVIFIGTILRFLNYYSSLLRQKIKNTIATDLSQSMLRSYFRIPYISVLKKKEGYYVSRIYDEPKSVSFLTIDTGLNLLSSIVTTITALGIIIYLSWKVTLVLLAIIPFLYLISKKFASKISSISSIEKEKEARVRDKTVYIVSSYRIIKIFNLYDISSRIFLNAVNHFFAAIFKKVRLVSLYKTLNEITTSLMEFMVLMFLGLGVILGLLSIGGLFGFMQAFWRLVNSFLNLIDTLPEIMNLKGYLKRIEEFEEMQREETIWNSESISLNKINFRFDNRWIIKNFSLHIKKGSKILITGPNGCGKTTLLNILSGFLRPEGDYKLADLDYVSAMIAPLEFIPGSLKENVNFEEMEDGKRAKFMKLSGAFNLNGKIDKPPSELSEGEKRKFSIIRTLMKDGEVFLFDEPLSGIDEESKDKIMGIIFKETKEKALIVVMHGDEKFHSLFDKQIKLEVVQKTRGGFSDR